MKRRSLLKLLPGLLSIFIRPSLGTAKSRPATTNANQLSSTVPPVEVFGRGWTLEEESIAICVNPRAVVLGKRT